MVKIPSTRQFPPNFSILDKTREEFQGQVNIFPHYKANDDVDELESGDDRVEIRNASNNYSRNFLRNNGGNKPEAI